MAIALRTRFHPRWLLSYVVLEVRQCISLQFFMRAHVHNVPPVWKLACHSVSKVMACMHSAGCGKSTEARKIMDLAEAEGLTAHVHATNERWWTHADCPHKCKCGVPVGCRDLTSPLT